MALSKETWFEIRAEYETTEISITKLAEKYGISRRAIQKKIAKEGWLQDIRARLQAEVEKKVAGMVTGRDVTDNIRRIDQEADKKVAIIFKHREQWDMPVNMLKSGVEFDEDGSIRKLTAYHITQAKRVAETLEIVQRNERIAWGISDQYGLLTELQIQNRNRLLQMCIDGEIENAAHAGMMFDLAGVPMPKSIEMILKRTPIDKPEPVVDDVFTEDELDAEYEAKMQEIEQQRAQWLPERVKGIEQMKHDMREGDSFSPGFKIQERKGD